eukprot:SAG31_NODE_3217_length_4537_cov_1.607481_5_plen_90_part_00
MMAGVGACICTSVLEDMGSPPNPSANSSGAGVASAGNASAEAPAHSSAETGSSANDSVAPAQTSSVRSVTLSFLWDFSRFHGTDREIRD